MKALKMIDKYCIIMVAGVFTMSLQPYWIRAAKNFYFIFIISYFLNQSFNV